MKLNSNRAGILYHVSTGYECFVPTPLQNIEINEDNEMISLIAEANLALGKLEGISTVNIDKKVILAKYVEKEAVISSQIEGTQASLSDVLQKNTKPSLKKDIEDIVNYVKAQIFGINLLDSLPISLRFIRLIHEKLLEGTRGEDKNPGEFRRSQNWIGPKGCTLNKASYIPPCVDKMNESLYLLEEFIHQDDDLQPLVKIALIHYQLETIHPFLDGNGRVGRLLIPLYLKDINILNEPLLYLSLYFKQNRNEYYSLLNDVRFKGKYEEWIKFFLKGLIEMSNSSVLSITRINNLINKTNAFVNSLEVKNKENIRKTIDFIYHNPYFETADLIEELSVTKPTALSIIKLLEDNKIITKVDPNKTRYVKYQFKEYLNILEEGTNI